MLRRIGTVLFFAILVAAAPAQATILTLPLIGDIEHPDLDPFHVLTPAPVADATPAPAKPMKKHHHKKK